MSFQSLTRTLALIAATALAAAPAATAFPWTPKDGKVKQVRFKLRNDSAQPIALHGGDLRLSIPAHATVATHAPNGDVLILDTATLKLPAGSTISVIWPGVAGATISVQ